MGGLGCDNMTVIIACLLQGSTYSDLASKCAEKSVARRDLSPPHEVIQNDVTSFRGLRDALYGDISEDPQSFEGVPASKLHDTYTDLDKEIKRQISKDRSKSDDDSSSSSPELEVVDGVLVNDTVSCDSQQLDNVLQPIETTV